VICIDPLITYPNRPHGHGQWCHLWDSEGDQEALHAFAARLGLQRRWFQNKQHDPCGGHYDLTAGKHVQALRLGAKLIERGEFIAHLPPDVRARLQA
jgi:hypothetical protein